MGVNENFYGLEVSDKANQGFKELQFRGFFFVAKQNVNAEGYVLGMYCVHLMILRWACNKLFVQKSNSLDNFGNAILLNPSDW